MLTDENLPTRCVLAAPPGTLTTPQDDMTSRWRLPDWAARNLSCPRGRTEDGTPWRSRSNVCKVPVMCFPDSTVQDCPNVLLPGKVKEVVSIDLDCGEPDTYSLRSETLRSNPYPLLPFDRVGRQRRLHDSILQADDVFGSFLLPASKLSTPRTHTYSSSDQD